MLKHLTADFVLIDLSFLEEIPAGNYIYMYNMVQHGWGARGGGGGGGRLGMHVRLIFFRL